MHTSKHRIAGFTLLEVLATVAIIAILSMIAMPAYRSFNQRAKIADGFAMADELKTRLSIFYQKYSAFPVPGVDSGWAASNIYASSAVAYVQYNTTSNIPTINPTAASPQAPILIWYKAQALGTATDMVVALVGSPDSSSNILWSCQASGNGQDLDPSLWPTACASY